MTSRNRGRIAKSHDETIAHQNPENNLQSEVNISLTSKDSKDFLMRYNELEAPSSGDISRRQSIDDNALPSSSDNASIRNIEIPLDIPLDTLKLEPYKDPTELPEKVDEETPEEARRREQLHKRHHSGYATSTYSLASETKQAAKYRFDVIAKRKQKELKDKAEAEAAAAKIQQKEISQSDNYGRKTGSFLQTNSEKRELPRVEQKGTVGALTVRRRAISKSDNYRSKVGSSLRVDQAGANGNQFKNTSSAMWGSGRK